MPPLPPFPPFYHGAVFGKPQASDVPQDSNSALNKFQAENAALRMALYESVKHDMVVKVIVILAWGPAVQKK